MLIRPPDLEIPEDDPFKNDALDRARLEPPLTEFVCQATGPFVLAIDGGWGTGKTTFLKMWQPKLRDRGCHCLYFNAWETDFTADPLVALVGELESAITDKKTAPARKKLKALAGSIVRRSIPVAVRVATQGLVSLDSTTEGRLGDLAAEVAADQIENYTKTKSDLDGFRKALQSLVEKIAPTGAPLRSRVVVFVDELDRCRPSYAVELMERIKHLFNVEGVVFVLGVDRGQLAHAVRVLYGTSFEAQGYLRRFIDLDYQLPKADPSKYYNHLFKVLDIERIVLSRSAGEGRQEIGRLQGLLGPLMAAAELSLREQLQIVSRLRVVLQTIPKDQELFEEALGLLIFLRAWAPETYQGIVARSVLMEEAWERLKALSLTRFTSGRRTQELIEAVLLRGGLELGLGGERLEEYQRLADSSEISPEQQRAVVVTRLAHQLDRGFRAGVGFGTTLRRIELAEPFQPAE
jgi:hypothetical protein